MQEAWVSSLVEEDPECCVAVSPAKEREKEKEKEREAGDSQEMLKVRDWERDL